MQEPPMKLLIAANQADNAPPSSSVGTGSALSGDILHGADAIAEYVFGDRKSRRKVYNLVETGQLPIFRLGANICARKSVLLDWIARQESEATASVPADDRTGDPQINPA
jgi:hypothetical protein